MSSNKNNKLRDEQARMAALIRHGILDTGREDSFEQIARLVTTGLDVPMAAVALVGAKNLSFKAAIGLEEADNSREESFCAVTIRSRQALVVPDAENDDRFADGPNILGKPFLRAYAGVPLQTADGYHIGTVAAFDTKRRTFTDTHLGLLEKLAGLAMEQIEMRQAGRTDPLTGALSRRGFLREVDREFFRCARYGRPASLLLMDVDNLHALNDEHGFEVGDQYLQAMGRACVGTLRLSDAFGRLGGQVFGMLLPETGPDDAMICAERLRTMIDGIVIRTSGTRAATTVSLGVAALTPELSNATRWMAVADVALYQAKRGGRNRCVSVDVAPALAPTPETVGEQAVVQVH